MRLEDLSQASGVKSVEAYEGEREDRILRRQTLWRVLAGAGWARAALGPVGFSVDRGL